ncbi:hypothetical protein [Paludifilum halophilum]|uniref:Uncharacterized protein n=1 Tax=Paludifilum halophilum TaxID=1642702 RepID=A0A235B5F6_9BACL|nr:hypothetical protein [Paludifilum halophilum]OYD07538.1 hypothetical protein CHM34_11635 [Paludifilum halophilum]
MHVIRWSIIFVLLTLFLMGLTAALDWYEPSSWQYSLRVAGGFYFLLALIASGIVSIPRMRIRTRKSVPREDWAFIFIVVTIALFGVSLWFT